MERPSTDQQRMLRDALDLLQVALDLLDRAAAPAQIGAHVDLAANQLAQAIKPPREPQIMVTEPGLARH